MNVEELTRVGVDYEQGARRFAGKTAIYEKFLGKFFQMDAMPKLREQLEQKDYEGAFRTAHDLKGTSGNLSMNEFYQKICALTEELRAGHPEGDVMAMYEDALKLYNEMEEIVKAV